MPSKNTAEGQRAMEGRKEWGVIFPSNAASINSSKEKSTDIFFPNLFPMVFTVLTGAVLIRKVFFDLI